MLTFVNRLYSDGFNRYFDGPVFGYSIRDNGIDKYDPEQNFGLVHDDHTVKPAYTMVGQIAATA